MTHRSPRPGSRLPKGFSLIELMISITIGLIIIGAVFSAYLGAAGATKRADAQSHMDEDAQSALIILAQQVRLAGINPKQPWTDQINFSTDTTIFDPMYLKPPAFAAPTYTNPPYDTAHAEVRLPKYVNANGMAPFALSAYTIVGCQGNFDNVKTAANLDALNCVQGNGPIIPDSFGVNYEADIYNTISTGPANAPAPTDCVGKQLNAIVAEIPQQPPPGVPPAAPSTARTPAPVFVNHATYEKTPEYSMADNRFYIETSSDTDIPAATPSLYCKGNGINSVAQPLVENVENMQILYGVQSPDVAGQVNSGSATPAGYLTATQLNNFASPVDGWHKVVTVRICLQMRSANRVVSNVASGSYRKCDGTLDTTRTDLLLRRTYSTTVVLRNKLL